jgi:hypothetical protein
MIDWKQVLEIETYLNRAYDQNRSFGNLSWRHDINTNLRVDTSRKYSFSDLIEYLRSKYPLDGLIKGQSASIRPLYDACLSGSRICQIDETLLSINEHRDRYLLSPEQLKINLLNECAEFTGSTAFYLRVLREIISDLKYVNPNCTLNQEIKEAILNKFKALVIPSGSRMDFEALKEKISTNSRFTSYIDSCQANNYAPPYTDSQKNEFLSDLLQFSRNEVLDIIHEDSNDLFNYKLRSNESTYASDLSITKFGNLNIYITLKGLFYFEVITSLKERNKITLTIQNILAKEFSILRKEAINDDFDPSYKVSGNLLDSSLIVGQINEYRQLYNEFTKGYHNKVIKGHVWVHDDVRGTSYDYLNFHSQNDVVGFSKHSMPFENVLYRYLITYLRKFRFNRKINEGSLPQGYHLSEEDYVSRVFNDNSTALDNTENDDMPF